MRIGLRIFTALMLLITSTFATAQADKASNARKAIQAAYNRRATAMINQDLDSYLADFASDYVYTKVNGEKRDMEATRALNERVMPVVQTKKANTKIVKFTLKGTQAVVITDSHYVVHLPNRQTGGTATLINHEKTEDIWQQSNGNWLEKKSRSLKDDSTIDGKPVVRPKKETGKTSE